jgi:predicted ester cyclase
MSDQDENKQTFQALYDEVINGGDLDAADKYVTIDRPDHDPSFPPEMTKGREGFKMAIGWLRSVFPDLKFTTKFMVAEYDYVVCYNTVEGTQKWEFIGMPPTGKKVKLNNIDICRFDEDGMIAEHFGTFNMAELMKQLAMSRPN